MEILISIGSAIIVLIIALAFRISYLKTEISIKDARINTLNFYNETLSDHILNQPGETFKLYDLIGYGRKKLIGNAEKRYNEIGIELNWISFYKGWIEGRAELLNTEIEKGKLLKCNIPDDKIIIRKKQMELILTSAYVIGSNQNENGINSNENKEKAINNLMSKLL